MFNLFRNKKKDQRRKLYFGLVLREEGGIGMILSQDESTQNITKIDEKSFTFSNAWEFLSEDIDDILFELEKRNNIEVSEAIFFMYSHMIDQKSHQIKTPYRKKIAKLIDDLELKGLGYVEYHEALSGYYQIKEEAPLTAIIVEIDKSMLSIFIYRGGELFFSDTIAKTENIVEDLTALFERVDHSTILPTRLVLYDADYVSQEASKIIDYRWDEKLFIQIPKIEILSEDDLEQILFHAVSNQLFNHEDVKTDQDFGLKGESVSGFFIDEDVAIGKKEPEPEVSKLKDPPEIPPSETGQKTPKNLLSFLTNIKYSSVGGIRLAGPLVFIVGILLVVSSLFSILFFFHKAALTVYLDSKNVKDDIKVTGSLGKKSDLTLEIVTIRENVRGRDEVKTTGEKTIGQKSHGIVSVFNSDTREKTFKKGAILKNSRGIRFLLDNDIKVASASESVTSEGNVLTVTGKVETSLVAEELGPEGNIASGEKLTIEDFPQTQFFATVKQSLTGGSKEEIKTVAKSDMEKLRRKVLEKIVKDLEKKQKKDDIEVLNELVEIKIEDERYSGEIGEEASKISLTVTGKAEIPAFEDKQMKNLLEKTLNKTIPEAFELSANNIQYEIKDVLRDEDVVTMQIISSGKAISKLEKEKFIKEVLGTGESTLSKVVKNKFNAKGYELNVTTPVPFLRHRIPFFKRNISLTVESLN